MAQKEKSRKIIDHKISRFAMIGIVNTAFDFIIFNTLRVITHTTVDQLFKMTTLNAISVTLVAIFSFYMNSRYVFGHGRGSKHQAALFILLTLVGIYLIQQPLFSLVLKFSFVPADNLYRFTNSLSGLNITINFYQSNIAKFCATIGSMVWNYSMYSRVVFRKNN